MSRETGRHGDMSRHADAVARTLRHAEDAAEGGDYRGAVSWLGLIEAIGDRLPDGYERKRMEWLAAAARPPTEPELDRS